MQPCSKERNMEMKREEKKAGYILWIPHHTADSRHY
jgi:hypothetical protein